MTADQRLRRSFEVYRIAWTRPFDTNRERERAKAKTLRRYLRRVNDEK